MTILEILKTISPFDCHHTDSKKTSEDNQKPTIGTVDTKHQDLKRKMACVLEKTCPAFLIKNDGGPAVWHKCFCRAMVRYGGVQPCICVWYEESECRFGSWPMLEDLVKKLHKIEKRRQKRRQRVDKKEKPVTREKETKEIPLKEKANIFKNRVQEVQKEIHREENKNDTSTS